MKSLPFDDKLGKNVDVFILGSRRRKERPCNRGASQMRILARVRLHSNLHE